MLCSPATSEVSYQKGSRSFKEGQLTSDEFEGLGHKRIIVVISHPFGGDFSEQYAALSQHLSRKRG